MLFHSDLPEIQIPTDCTVWQWAFSGRLNHPLSSSALTGPQLGGYIDATTHEHLSWPTVKSHATALSTALVQQYGLEPGDTVSLFSGNSIWYPVAMWAASRAGARVNGASPAYTLQEMVHALRTAHTRILIVAPDAVDVARQAAKNVGLSERNILLLHGSRPDMTSIQTLLTTYLSRPPSPAYSIPADKSNAQVCGFLTFSSGTTGLPKAVMLSHHNIIAQCLQLSQLQVLARTNDGQYRILAVMPLFHITGLVRFCVYPSLMRRGLCVVLPKFSMEGTMKATVEFGVEELILVPPIFIRLVRDPVVAGYLADLRKVVKRWSSGSAPIAPEVLKLLAQKFPETGFRQGYGATESTACVSAHPPRCYGWEWAARQGRLVANTTVKVVDLGTGRELGVGETGEICAKGPQIAMGYLGNEKATREAFREGWLFTGDVGFMDREGFVNVRDRIKEMIKVKGIQVAPAELEDVLLGCEEVEDCAVVGTGDVYAGERPKAFVVGRREGLGKEEMEVVGGRVMEWVKGRTVRYKWLVEVEFVESVPKSPTGKLLRRVLREMERDERRRKGVCVREEKGDKARL